MAFHGYASFKGTTQGSFKGQPTAGSGQTKAKVQFAGWKYAVQAQYDRNEGLSTGKRQHTPFVITRVIDFATPLLLQAFHASTAFPEVVVQIVSTASGGKETVVETITLKNATISDVKHYMTSGPRHTNASTSGATIAVYTFTYDRIKIAGA